MSFSYVVSSSVCVHLFYSFLQSIEIKRQESFFLSFFFCSFIFSSSSLQWRIKNYTSIDAMKQLDLKKWRNSRENEMSRKSRKSIRFNKKKGASTNWLRETKKNVLFHIIIKFRFSIVKNIFIVVTNTKCRKSRAITFLR